MHYNTKGGTTFFSSLIAAAPDVASRYECGLLQARTPSEIPSIRPEVQKNMIRHWQLPDDWMLSKSEFERNEDTDGNQMVAAYQIDEGQCRDGIL